MQHGAMKTNDGDTVYLVDDHEISNNVWLPKGLSGTVRETVLGAVTSTKLDKNGTLIEKRGTSEAVVRFENHVLAQVSEDLLSDQPVQDEPEED